MVAIPRGIMVSCQPLKDYIENVCEADVKCIRVSGAEDVAIARSRDKDLCIIAVDKATYPNSLVRITPENRISQLFEAGADYVAVDATGRQQVPDIPNLIADISDVSQLKKTGYRQNKFAAITTALSGYSPQSLIDSPFEFPDFALLQNLTLKRLEVPIIAEGRYWTLGQVMQAFNLGAYSVCIGSAITRPTYIMKYFKQVESLCT